jgi:hypothetical protein
MGGEVGRAPEVQTLAKGWFMLKLRKEEEVEWVLKSPWYIDLVLVLLKKWSPLFDASRERVDELPIWVRLSGLPSVIMDQGGIC